MPMAAKAQESLELPASEPVKTVLKMEAVW